MMYYRGIEALLSSRLLQGQIMGLDVKSNSDGSFTVSCGNDSVTLHPPGKSEPADPKGGILATPDDKDPFPIITIGNGGIVTAHVYRPGALQVRPIDVYSLDELSIVIQSTAGQADTLTRCNWKGRAALDVAKVSEIMRHTPSFNASLLQFCFPRINE